MTTIVLPIKYILAVLAHKDVHYPFLAHLAKVYVRLMGVFT
jgi:hypothetical protein